MSGYEGRGDYFARKQVKLLEQQAIEQHSDILAGCQLHINGHTDPPHEQLKAVIIQLGATYHQYPHFGRLTHLITMGVSRQRQNALPRQLLVVTPAWVLACQREGRRVPEAPYRLYHLEAGQQTLPSKRPLSPEETQALQEDQDYQNLQDQQDYQEQDDLGQCDSSEGEGENEGEHSTGLPARCTGACPDTFLANYLQHSRLHWLSHWKQEAKRLASTLMAGKRPAEGKVVVLHVDLDCFFAAVGVRNRPELQTLPVAIAHAGRFAETAGSTSEIASCNYPARAHGLHNGMSVRRAQALCPQLVVLPYEFDRYRETMQAFYAVLAKHATRLVAVSCDEAYLTVNCHHEPPAVITKLRHEVREACGIAASVGAGPNYLVARMACAAAKPNGQLVVSDHEMKTWLAQQPLDRLPGMGPALRQKLPPQWQRLGELDLEAMTSRLGAQLGSKLWRLARGEAPLLPPESDQRPQSIGLEVTWGVRFTQLDQLERFLRTMLVELQAKLLANGVQVAGRLQLRLLQRATDEPPYKRLGCGSCTAHHCRLSLGWRPTGQDLTRLLLAKILTECTRRMPLTDLRGIGLHCSQLGWQAPFAWTKPDNESKHGEGHSIDLEHEHSNEMRNEAQFLRRHGIAEDCWRELPPTLQQQLMAEETNLPVPSTPPRPTKAKVGRDSRRHIHGTTLTQLLLRKPSPTIIPRQDKSHPEVAVKASFLPRFEPYGACEDWNGLAELVLLHAPPVDELIAYLHACSPLQQTQVMRLLSLLLPAEQLAIISAAVSVDWQSTSVG